MPSRSRFLRGAGLYLLLACTLQLPAASRFTYHVTGSDPGPWPSILASAGLVASFRDDARVIVVSGGVRDPGWDTLAANGAILIVIGDSPVSTQFGFRATEKGGVRTRSLEDLRAPELRVIWEHSLDLPVFEIPAGATIFARERWQKAPLMAGLRKGKGGVLWIAAAPGENGYERFPYILQALADLGFEPPFPSRRLWGFFDSSYRLRADPEYLAVKWRAAGIAALQIAAWHHWERDASSDEYLKKLIEACHRHAILVYAWIEFPHVSEKFWDDHPEWREKTAVLQDAQLDWRKLMNLSNPSSSNAVGEGLKQLMKTFDWDGINLAELYFESLEGHDNAARFTPMNEEVRREFRQLIGFDPVDLFDVRSPRHWSRNAEGLSSFLQYRAELARRLQEFWLGRIEALRREKPELDIVLTHIDDRFDTSMREKLGADTSRVLPLLKDHDFTLLIEDPATVWNLGPKRYPQIASRYASAAPRQDKLAIDINIVERYQDVYPTKQQTGVELYELVHMAAGAFPRVALYFENSISRVDWPLLASAGSVVERIEESSSQLAVTAKWPVGVPWNGAALVDGKLWPVASGTHVWMPAGRHVIQHSAQEPALRILDFNGEIVSAKSASTGLDLSYQSSSRAIAILDPTPGYLEIDGVAMPVAMRGNALTLPRGQHIVTMRSAPPPTSPVSAASR